MNPMHERIIEAIVARILAELPEGGTHSRTSMKDTLTRTAAPPSLLNFLDRTLERRTQLEIRDALDSAFAWFDSADAGVGGALDHLRHEAARAAWFPPDEWPRSVHHAVETTLSYLLDPTRTLVSFLFADGSDSALATDVRRRSGYFRDYSHLTRAVGAFIDKKNEDRISRHELTGVLRHVDRNIVSEFDADGWIHHMTPLVTFVSFSGLISEGLPVAFASRFLEARGHMAARDAVESAADKARADMISVPTLTSLLRTLGAGEPASEAVTPPATATQAQVEPAPLWKQFSKPTDAAIRPTDAPPGPGEPLWKTFQERAAATEPDVPDLERQVIGTGGPDRKRIVAELFAGDASLYRTVLARLHTAPDWTAASRILANDVYRPHAVDIYSETAVAFTNAVESRYHPHSNQS